MWDLGAGRAFKTLPGQQPRFPSCVCVCVCVRVCVCVCVLVQDPPGSVAPLRARALFARAYVCVRARARVCVRVLVGGWVGGCFFVWVWVCTSGGDGGGISRGG